MIQPSRVLPIVLLAAILPCMAGDDSVITSAPAESFHDESLTFEERVRYQRGIEEVYWSHRIWPAENPGRRPPLEEVLPDGAICQRVATYLEKSAALRSSGRGL